MMLLPGCSAMLFTVQFAVPVAVPLPPALFVQLTCVTPTLSDAVPPSANGLVLVVYVPPLVGFVIVAVGAVVSGGGKPPTGAFMSAWTSACVSARLYIRTSSIFPAKLYGPGLPGR